MIPIILLAALTLSPPLYQGGPFVGPLVTIEADCVDPPLADGSPGSGCAGVMFSTDGTSIGVEDTTEPYSTVWDASEVSEGEHEIACIGRDNAGNIGLCAPITVRVDRTGPNTSVRIPPPGQQ